MEIEDIKKILDIPLPSESISQHPTKTYLSTIKAIYVTERFNDAFGVGGWQTFTELVKHVESSGMVVVKVTFQVPSHSIYYECYGGNDNGGTSNKNFDLGDAFKGATTDALTKIGSYLGVGIDVFKNKIKTSTTAPKNDDEDNKAWITVGDKAWMKALEKGLTVKDLRESYKVSKANAAAYEAALNN